MNLMSSTSDDFFQNSLEHVSTAIQNAPIYYCTGILSAFVERGIDTGSIRVKLFSEIIRNVMNLSIPDYISIWSTLGKMKLSETDPSYMRLSEALKKVLFDSPNYKSRDFTTKELGELIISLAANKIKDPGFLKLPMNIISSRLEHHVMTSEELAFLSTGLYSYSRTFEDVFLKFHDLCAKEFSSFSSEQLQHLSKVFKLKEQIVPRNSPFLKYI